jgi:hypothetical protein
MSVEVSHIIEETERFRVTQEKTNELLIQHTRQGAHDIAEHRIKSLEDQLKVLMTIQRLNKMRDQSPSE